MKNYFSITLLVGLFILAGVTDSSAQKAKKYDNPQWKNVVFVDYVSGKAGRANEIISDYYIPASTKAGISGPEMALVMQTGPWDVMIIWHMAGGLDDMNWDIHPNNVKWRKALSEICGGDDKASEILKEYASCVARSSSALGRVR